MQVSAPTKKARTPRPDSQRALAAAAGIPRTTMLRRAREDRFSRLEALMQSLAARLDARPEPAPAAAPMLSAPAADARRPAPEAPGPLGTAADYAGEIFGVTVKRRPRIGAPATSAPRLTVVIGDTHFHPAIMPKTLRAMTLAGLHVAAVSPEHLVHIGDVSDLASVCSHVRNDTWGAREKPSIRQDLDCMRENWAALNAPIRRSGIAVRKHVTKGNHCAWLSKYEDEHPEIKGIPTAEFDDILSAEGWSFSDYGEFYYVGGVGYVHVPLNLMGRPVGGQTGENTIAMQSTCDVVLGHTHRYAVGRRIKLDGQVVTALNAATCMPEFYVGEYAQLTAGRKVDYGILEVTDFDGRIQSHRFVTARELEARYGDAADRILR